MLDFLKYAPGERLLGDAYWADFEENFWKTDRSGFWKLERLQQFREPSDDSWIAFSEGRWQESLALLHGRRGSLASHYDKIRGHGFETWRLRVVEQPLTAYMHWELNLLRLRNELGGHTRVIDVSHVKRFESDEVLPELITLGDNIMYRLLYDETGLQQGGVRYEQCELVVRCRELIQGLYHDGEDVEDYFVRESSLRER